MGSLLNGSLLPLRVQSCSWYHSAGVTKTATPAPASHGDDFNDLVNESAGREAHPLTIPDLMETYEDSQRDEQALLLSGQFLQKELPVRMAKIVKDMQKLPFIVGMNPYVKLVYTQYCRSFESLVRFPAITSLPLEREYTMLLDRLVEEHKDVIPLLSKGMNECAKHISPATIKEFLDTKIHDRIGIRVLAEQHIALHSERREGYAGIINTKLNPRQLILGVSQGVQVSSPPLNPFLCVPPSHHGRFNYVCVARISAL